MSFQVTAILAAYNEEDIVGAAISHLAAEGVQVYLIDHGSTDATLDEVRRFEGRGVIGFEQLPAGDTVRWADVLRRKEALARELPGDWFIHHDADEFRESPWSEVSLLDGIRRVDALGFNAIDFELLQFRPTHDGFQKGDDPLVAFPFFEPCLDYDRLQIKCWKRSAEVAIAESGGHDVDIPGRRVFPIRFLLRHYPIRTQTQGTRKVIRDRLFRFEAEEHARGWHRQYAGMREGKVFLRDPAELTRFDADAVRTRLCIEHRGVENLIAELDEASAQADVRTAELSAAREEVERLHAIRSELENSLADAARLQAALRATEAELGPLRTALSQLEVAAQLRQALIDKMLTSWSWRSTAAARAVLKRLRGY